MDKYDLLEAMGGIRDRYIEDAGFPSAVDQNQTAAEPDNRPEIIAEELRRIENQIDRLLDLYALGNIPTSAIQTRIADLTDQRNRLDAELASIENEKNDRITKDEVLGVIRSFDEVLDRANFDETRIVISELIDSIEIDGDDLVIHWRFC